MQNHTACVEETYTHHYVQLILMVSVRELVEEMKRYARFVQDSIMAHTAIYSLVYFCIRIFCLLFEISVWATLKMF